MLTARNNSKRFLAPGSVDCRSTKDHKGDYNVKVLLNVEVVGKKDCIASKIDGMLGKPSSL